MIKLVTGTEIDIVMIAESVTEIEEVSVTEIVNVREIKRVTAKQIVKECVTMGLQKKIRAKVTQTGHRKQVNNNTEEARA